MLKTLNELKELLPTSKGLKKANILFEIGFVLMTEGKYDIAFATFKESLEFSRKNEFKSQEALTLNSISRIYFYWSELEKALEFSLKALKIFEKIGEKIGIGRCLINISIFYANQQNYEKSLEINEKAIEIFKELNDEKGLAATLGNSGLNFYHQGKIKDSINFSKQSLRIYQKLGEKAGEINALNNISRALYSIGKINEALDYTEKTLVKAEEFGNNFQISLILITMGQLLIKLNRIDEAKKQLYSALDISQKYKFTDCAKDCYKYLSEAFEEEKDYLKAFENYKLFIEMKELITKKNNEKIVSNLRTKYETEQKEKEAEIYRLKNVELRDTLKELQETQSKLIESEKYKMFYAMVVTANHELNQPLSVMKISLEMLKLKHHKTLDEKTKSHLEKISKSVERCNKILQKLRDLKTPIYKKYMEDVEMVDLDNK